MARQFTKSTANYMSLGINAIGPLVHGAQVVCIHAWVWVDSFDVGGGVNNILTIINDGTDEGISLMLGGSSPVITVRGRAIPGGVLNGVSGVSAVPLGKWVSVGARLCFSGDITNAVFLSGHADAINSAAWGSLFFVGGVPTADDRIGSRSGGVVSQWFDGRIAEVAIWTNDIGDNAFALLAGGLNPFAVQFPRAYFSLYGGELYWPWGAVHAQIVGSIPSVAHPVVGVVDSLETQHRLLVKYKTEGGTDTTFDYTYTVNSTIRHRSTIAAGVSDKRVNVTIPLAYLQSFAISCDRHGGFFPEQIPHFVVKTNSPITPTETFQIKVGRGVAWGLLSPVPNPLTDDVTSLYVSNIGGGHGDLTVLAGFVVPSLVS